MPSKTLITLAKKTGCILALAGIVGQMWGQELLQKDPYEPERLPAEELLLRTVPYFSQDNQPVEKVLQAVGRSCGITIICDKDVQGTVNFEAHNLSLRAVLDALCSSEGYFWTLEEGGYVSVRRFGTAYYMIEYPHLDRSGATKSSIQLGSTNYSSDNNGSGSSGSSQSGSGNRDSEDEASVSLEQKNDVKFWDKIEKGIETFKGKDESITIDRFSGIVAVTASQRTHEKVRDYIAMTNSRINQQVEIIGRIVEVTLDDQNKLGVDWALVREASWGDLIFGPDGTSFGTSTNIQGMNGADLASETFTGTIGAGKVQAVVHALSQQGSLNGVTAPRLVTANNQTAYIKDTLDQPFFQLQSSTTQSTVGSSTDNLIDSKSYNIQTISIGTIIAVTPHIADNGDIKLDILPAITRLKEVLYSPSDDGDTTKRGQSNAPSLYVKQMSSLVTLRSGETAVIGGIVTDSEGEQTRKVPFLGDLPLVGHLFRTDARVVQKTELVIFLTPRIVSPGESLPSGTPVRTRAGALPPGAPAVSSSASGAVESFSLLN